MLGRFLPHLLDAWDDREARLLRAELGGHRWLVSWTRRDDGRWLARVSCPSLPTTVERDGRSRCRAIRRAEAALHRLLGPDDEPTPGDYPTTRNDRWA
jgi:hypothetical protein